MSPSDSNPDVPEDARDLLDAFLSARPTGDSDEFRAWVKARGAQLPEEGLLRFVEGVLGRLESGARPADSVFAPGPLNPDPPERTRTSFVAGNRIGPFVLRRFIAAGGMGQVWEAEDSDLDRRVALKLLLPDSVDERSLERFEREARAGGRLQHPNLVTTFGHGSSDGLAWIAQELVPDAWTLKDFIDRQRSRGTSNRSYYAAVAELVVALADGLHVAHEAGVIHRDVKPANVLLDRSGAPRLTDFGLARLSNESRLSVSGDIVGTWSYMSPEQVRARRSGIDRRTDVFSLGVVLYELLTLRRPFEGDSVERIARQILYEDPPAPTRLRTGCPEDLSLICTKALEKSPDRRYSSSAAFAEDLRRHLSHQPIVARPPSTVDRAARWMRRHPASTTGVTVGLIALAVVSVLLVEQVRTARAMSNLAADRADQVDLARASEVRALDAERTARKERDDVLRLSAMFEAEALMEEQALLWPPHPEQIESLRSWVRRAEDLIADRDRHQATLRELRARALPRTEAERREQRENSPFYPRLVEVRSELAELVAAGASSTASTGQGGAANERTTTLEADLAELEARVDERIEWTFDTQDDYARWWSSQLELLLHKLSVLKDQFLNPQHLSRDDGWSVAKRLEFAEGLAQGFAVGGEYEQAWAAHLPALRADYPQLDIEPWMGLVPLGPDPGSGFHEFAHLASGTVPIRDGEGALVRHADTGAILVLVPGGEFWMGAQFDQPDAPVYDADTRTRHFSRAPRRVRLSAYLIAKYEWTQAQWRRLTGTSPSWFLEFHGEPADMHPVDSVSWAAVMRDLTRVDLTLPTEAQWEFACRAGTETPFSFGGNEDINHVLNAAGLTARKAGETWALPEGGAHDDGFAYTAPVGALPPNAFGLHEMHGNVFEICLDSYREGAFTAGELGDDPLVEPSDSGSRVVRGGSYMAPATACRSTLRRVMSMQGAGRGTGFRAGRPL